MSDVTPNNELELLKERADKLGLQYHPSIGLDKLREKVNAALTPTEEEVAQESKAQLLKKEANKLVRINVTCMNPAKRNWHGEIFTTGNSVVGTIRKFVPFNTENGYHVPNAIYQMMKNRKCQVFYTEKTKKGVDVRKGKLIKEFAIDVLDPLSPEELDNLAREQAARHSID